MEEKPMGRRHTIKLLAQIAISAAPEASISSHPIILHSVDDLFYSPFTYTDPPAMPIDGHAHLVAQGWSGKGSGLRPGAISRPIVVAQKKTLSGIGKDRDEAFPFWDQCVLVHIPVP